MIANAPTELPVQRGVEHAVGRALAAFRTEAELTIRKLSELSGVSSAMISRIENGQVSPSLATLSALAAAVGVPLANLFRHTVDSVDITHVEAGKGLSAERLGSTFWHQFQVLGYHKRQDMRFEPYLITLTDNDDETREPNYYDQGCEFVYLLDGEMIYRYGPRTYQLRPGDSLSFDAVGGHGPEKLLQTPVRYLLVFAQRL